ncbi:Crp/Fnr family transcriptional regulator [Neptuniibacter sp. CAU 1671]|uniref:Crp/Fnr family transcriptional regulator n=1 Tax=Neptuniibacter sp. CAU 1671 TaxID=3032593 RepID=UPI0023DB8922|nr:Crp/Fnr family transcriptional regulator [Neptuniibacter sp. CAU 1671]MDF2183126.1 Crp/Fnr family transcriptional regulator [Neptuniibacter sp. CAU 1671]
MNADTTQHAFAALKSALDIYYPLHPDTWAELQTICHCRTLDKGQFLYPAGKTPTSFAFVFKGLFRSFITDCKGHEYNKIFFDEGTFPGSMVALLTGTASEFSVEALEPAVVIEIAFQPYRKLLEQHHDLALFQVQYLEKNWLLSKEPREVALVQEEARQRYERFVAENPTLHKRLPQYLIASHLGITPTQLSRIKKNR